MRVERSGGFGLAAQSNQLGGAKKKNEKSLSSILEKLASGKAINRSSDDAAGLAISERLRSQVRGYKTAGRNVHDAMSALNISEGASSQVDTLLQRQRTLASRARNGTMTMDDRQALNQEFQQISEEIDRISETTTFNGQKMTNGTELGSGSSSIAAGSNGEALPMPEVNISTGALGSAGLDIASVAGAEAALGALDLAIDSVVSQRATIGSATNRFESVVSTLEAAEINSQAAESVIRDQDMAEGISQMIRDRLLSDAGNSAFSMFNRISSDHIQGLLE